jgi:hypothetical protein
MKALIAALALVTLMASPSFAQWYPGEQQSNVSPASPNFGDKWVLRAEPADFWVQSPCDDFVRANAAGPCAGRIARALEESNVFKKIRIASIAAATLFASPAFAGGLVAQPTPLEPIDSQRIIRVVVVDGRLIEGVSEESLANELRPVPSWVDQSSALDRRPQPSW